MSKNVNKIRLTQIIKNILSKPLRLINILGFIVERKFKPNYMFFKPIALDVEPTINCNFACKFCQITTWDRISPDLSLNGLKNLLEKVPSVIKIKLQGMGEPLLNKDFYEMVKHLTSKDIWVETTSNGSMLTEKTCEKIVNSKLGIVKFSVDGATAKTFEEIRVNGNFSKVIEGIKLLVSKRKNSTYPQIRIWMVGTKQNIHELPDLVQLCHNLGVDELILQFVLGFWGKKEWIDSSSDQALSEEYANEHVEKATLLAQKLNFTFKCFDKNKFSIKDNKMCFWPWNSAYITADQYVCPCCIACDPDLVNMGNLNEKSFDEIWNGEEYRNLRKGIKQGNLPEFCKGCYSDFD